MIVTIQADETNLPAVVTLAEQYGVGIETRAFASPSLTKREARERIQAHSRLLKRVPFLGMHGIYYPELCPHSADPVVRSITRTRQYANVDTAAQLGIPAVVFHLGHWPMLRSAQYDAHFIDNSVTWYAELGAYAATQGVSLKLENVWETLPALQKTVVEKIGLPTVRACLDVGHANVYSPEPLSNWIATLGETCNYVHLHNNNGHADLHAAIDKGTVPMAEVLSTLRSRTDPLVACIEVKGSLQELERSIRYLRTH